MKNEENDIKNFEEKFKGAKKNNFSVPEGYFDALPGRISEAIVSRSKQADQKVFFLRPRFVVSLAAAATILIVLGLNFSSFMNYLDPEKINETPISFQSVTEEEIVDYLLEEDVNEEALMDLAITGMAYTSPMNISRQEMEEYAKEHIEEDLIFEEL